VFMNRSSPAFCGSRFIATVPNGGPATASGHGE